MLDGEYPTNKNWSTIVYVISFYRNIGLHLNIYTCSNSTCTHNIQHTSEIWKSHTHTHQKCGNHTLPHIWNLEITHSQQQIKKTLIQYNISSVVRSTLSEAVVIYIYITYIKLRVQEDVHLHIYITYILQST